MVEQIVWNTFFYFFLNGMCFCTVRAAASVSQLMLLYMHTLRINISFFSCDLSINEFVYWKEGGCSARGIYVTEKASRGAQMIIKQDISISVSVIVAGLSKKGPFALYRDKIRLAFIASLRRNVF